MTKHKVSELEGSLLDAAVAESSGLYWQTEGDRCFAVSGRKLAFKEWATDGAAIKIPTVVAGPLLEFRPHADWSHGGPIIEREVINVSFQDSSLSHVFGYEGPWTATIWVHGRRMEPGAADDPWGKGETVIGRSGATPLIAAMRAYVASKFGEEVEL